MISEGVYARYLHGAMGDQGISDEQLNAFKNGTEILAESALEAMQRLNGARLMTSKPEYDAVLDGWERGEFTAAGLTHATYRAEPAPASS